MSKQTSHATRSPGIGPVPPAPEAVRQAEAISDILPDLIANQEASQLDYIDTLPRNVQRRIQALKKLQFQYNEVESEFMKEISRLEQQYQEKFHPILQKRSAIICGRVEPTDEEVWKDQDSSPEAEQGAGAPAGPDEKMEQEICDLTTKVKISNAESVATGIPDFWLTTLRNVELLDEQIYEWDYPALKHLEDIKLVFPDAEGLNYILEFYFSPNPFFSDTVLTKWYSVKCDVDPNDPFQFNGPEIINCNGCEVHWLKGKNLTKKLKKKKQRPKGRGQTKVISKLVPQESFFNFFSPPNIPDDLSLLDDDQGIAIELDFSIAELLKDRVLPKAVLYFTGEILLSGTSSQIDGTSDNTSLSADEEFNRANKHVHFNHDSDSDNEQTKDPSAGRSAGEKPPECDKQVQ